VTFELFPAIDLRDGQVVRLVQGDFARETAYGNDPAAVAASHVAAGARWLHLVDLDGARSGAPTQTQEIARIVATVRDGVRCQVAGGLRSPASVRTALEGGAARVVVGTAALRDPAFARALVDEHGADRIAVALDVRDGMALGDGWGTDATSSPVEAALLALTGAGVTTFIATAIDRDGLLGGPDLDFLGRLVALDRGQIVASGGVTTIEDILAVRDLGCGGAIVGRAIYEGRLDLAEAFVALGSAETRRPSV
jgi:phosphoribosylformimino-5-aminoimidazole carboxamide ribotide isomerase